MESQSSSDPTADLVDLYDPAHAPLVNGVLTVVRNYLEKKARQEWRRAQTEELAGRSQAAVAASHAADALKLVTAEIEEASTDAQAFLWCHELRLIGPDVPAAPHADPADRPDS